MTKIVATYEVKVTLREQPNQTVEEAGVEPPTNARVEQLVESALFTSLPYFGTEEISVESTRTDK